MTRTALKRNGLSELHIRSARKGAKAPIKTREQNQRQNEQTMKAKTEKQSTIR